MQPVLQLKLITKDHHAAPLQAVKAGESKLYYCETLAISMEAGQYVLHTNSDKLTLQNGDTIDCGGHQFQVNIQQPNQTQIAFHEPRAPTQTLSEQWQQAGMDPFMSEQRLAPAASMALTTTAPLHDPLAFLQAETTQAAPSSVGLTVSPPALPLQQYVDVPSLSTPSDSRTAARHISQAPHYHPLRDHHDDVLSSRQAATAPIDQIDDLYKEAQSQPFTTMESQLDPTTTADEQQHIKELYHLINQ